MSVEERDYIQLESQEAAQKAPTVGSFYSQVLQWIILALSSFLLAALVVRILGLDQFLASIWWLAALLVFVLAPLTLNYLLEANSTTRATSFLGFWAVTGVLTAVAVAPTGHLYGGLPFEIALATAIGVLLLFWIGNGFLSRDPIHPKTTLFATLIPMKATMLVLPLFSSTGWISQITLLFLFVGFFGAHVLFTRIALRMNKQREQKAQGSDEEDGGVERPEAEPPIYFAARILFDPLIHPFTIAKGFLQK